MQAAFRALASSLHYLWGAFNFNTRAESYALHSANPVHSRKQSAGCFRICQKQPAPFIYLIYLNKISAKAHRARFCAAGLRTEAGKQFATDAVRVFR